MQTLKLENVFFERSNRAVATPTLYCRSNQPIGRGERAEEWVLPVSGLFDFLTYFNGLSIRKWRRYTVAKDFILHIELKGGSCHIAATYADTFAKEPLPIPDCFIDVEKSDEWQIIELELTAPEEAEIVGFTIETEGDVIIRDSYYYTRVEDSALRPVELALATVTFKKESYILANIAALKSCILETDEPLAEHFNVHVIDNGRTLDAPSLNEGRIHIHPNPNVGGSGGFARGMIEALDQAPKATHVLLMDDDVAVAPESIIRTFNLLRIANDEYAEAFIGGAMLNFQITDDQCEDLGVVHENGDWSPVKPPLRISLLENQVFNEELYSKEDYTYAAWWYCCIPTSVIERNGLPLPLFIRCDDVEYSLRCKPKFITMCGIGIWHEPFHTRYNAAVERYQTVRNTLIIQAVSGVSPDVDYVGAFTNMIQIELKKFNYDNAELALDGFEDYLKGPSFIAQNLGEEITQRNARKSEKLLPFEDIATMEEFPEIESRADVYEDKPRSFVERLIDFVSFSGQRLPDLFLSDEPALIPSEGWLYPAKTIRMKRRLLAVDVHGKRGIVRTMDKDRFRRVWKRYKKDMREYRMTKDSLNKSYADAKDYLTSRKFWLSYLGLDKT